MKKALIWGTYQNAPYHPFQGVDEILSGLLKNHFEVTLTDQRSDLLLLQENGYELLISYLDDFDHVFPGECAEAILEYVRKGGGLLCLHNGISLQTDERMFHLIGGKFLCHPPQTNITFKTTSTGIFSDLPGFTLFEEPYQFALSGDMITPLLTYQYNGLFLLGGWSREEGNGRVVFLTPGHSIRTFRQKEYLDMIYRSVEWLVDKRERCE